MTPEKLAELEALEAAATPSPWEEDDYDAYADNAEFLRELRNNARDLFAALRRSWSENVRLRAELQSHDCTYGDTPGLIHCPIDKPCTTHKLERITKGEK